MRAIRVASFGPPSVMQLQTIPVPAIAPTEVLIRVRAVGINPVETYIRSGVYSSAGALPYTPGEDAAGVIEAIGESVPKTSSLRVGMRVYTQRTRGGGAYAEQVAAPFNRVQPIPGTLSFAEATALCVPYHTAYRALFVRLRIRAGKTLFVHGATGAVGVAACQMGRAAGLRVIGSAGSEVGAVALSQWCDVVVRHGDAAVTVKTVTEATGGAGVDFLVENLANVNLQTDLQLLAYGGAVCVVGSRGDVSISPRLLMGKESTVTGVMLGASTDADWAEAAAYLAAGVAAGTLRPVVGTVYKGLEHAPQAHEEVISHSAGAHGKIVIEVD